MMRLNEFPTEEELRVMIAEVDQVRAMIKKIRLMRMIIRILTTSIIMTMMMK